MSLTVTFTTFAEKMPEEGQRLLLLKPSSFYSQVQIEVASIDRMWDEVDEDGNETGNSVIWNPGDEPMEGYVLSTHLVGEDGKSFSIEPADIWTPWRPIDEALCALLDAAPANFICRVQPKQITQDEE